MDEYGKRTKWWVGRDLTEVEEIHACVDNSDRVPIERMHLFDIESLLEDALAHSRGITLRQQVEKALALLRSDIADCDRLMGF